MRISVKGRYALAAMIDLGRSYPINEHVTVISISDRLGISKIYLEQVFALLKRAHLVQSVKGSQGGYKLTRLPKEISVFDILSAVENSLFDQTEETVKSNAPEVEAAMRLSVFAPLDETVKTNLAQITLEDLILESEKQKTNQAPMFFI